MSLFGASGGVVRSVLARKCRLGSLVTFGLAKAHEVYGGICPGLRVMTDTRVF